MSSYYYVLSVNGLLLLFSIVFYFFQPKKINALYGYRSNKTIKNDDIWKYSNAFFGKHLLLYAAISFAFAMILAFLNPVISWQPMALMLLAIAITVIKTEQEINKTFNEEGERKK